MLIKRCPECRKKWLSWSPLIEHFYLEHTEIALMIPHFPCSAFEDGFDHSYGIRLYGEYALRQYYGMKD